MLGRGLWIAIGCPQRLAATPLAPPVRRHRDEMHAHLTGVTVRQGGVFTVRQARELGYTADEMRARLRSGRWIRVRHGIYRPAGPVDDYRVAAAAAVLACRGSDPTASHRCAATLLDLPLLDSPYRPELTLAERSNTTAVKGCVIHRSAVPQSQRSYIDGIPVTDASRTVVDLARSVPFAEAVVTADAALRSGATTQARLLVASIGFRGRPTYARIARVLDFATDRSASPGESVARTMFAEQGLPAPLVAHPIAIAGQIFAEADFLWEQERTIGEFDGRVKYRRDNDRGDDVLWQEKLREERLREAGFEVVRMTWAQVTKEPRQTADRVRAAFARQRHQLLVG
jgi:hypothetical protein